MEFINIIGPAATQNTGLHCSPLYDCIVLSCCILLQCFLSFLFAVNFVIFNLRLRATILLSLNLNLKITNNKCSAAAEMGDRLAAIDMDRKLGGCAPLGGLGPHVAQCGLA